MCILVPPFPLQHSTNAHPRGQWMTAPVLGYLPLLWRTGSSSRLLAWDCPILDCCGDLSDEIRDERLLSVFVSLPGGFSNNDIIYSK